MLQKGQEQTNGYIQNLRSRYRPTVEKWPSHFETFTTPYGNLIVNKVKNKLYAFPTCRRYHTIISRIYDDANISPADDRTESAENELFEFYECPRVPRKLLLHFQGVNCSKKFEVNSPFDLMHLYEFIPQNEFIQKQKHPISKNKFYVKMHFFSEKDFETRVKSELRKEQSQSNFLLSDLVNVEKTIRAKLMIEDSEGSLRYRLCTFTSSPNRPHVGTFEGINLWSEIYPAHGVLREALMRYRVIFCSDE